MGILLEEKIAKKETWH